MRELDIRRTLRNELEVHHAGDPTTLILDELAVCNGQRRIDLAVVNGELIGYEIKSDADKLVRLPGQRSVYGQIFDRMWLVVGRRHYDRALTAVPEWWGIELVQPGSSGLSLIPLRDAEANLVEQDAVSIARLLWRDEAIQLLDEFSLGDGKLRRGSKRHMHAALAGGLDLPTLKNRVRGFLQSRVGWRS